MKREINLKAISTLVLTCLIAFVMIYTITSMFTLDEKTAGMQVKSIEDTIRKSAVQCYALEGAYPPNVAYLRDNYGLILDEEKYLYYYDATFGSNVMPDIMVISLQ